jgi:hypothetical protein
MAPVIVRESASSSLSGRFSPAVIYDSGRHDPQQPHDCPFYHDTMS